MLDYTLLKGHSVPLWVGAPEASAEEDNVVDRVKAVAIRTINSTGIKSLRMIHLQRVYATILYTQAVGVNSRNYATGMVNGL